MPALVRPLHFLRGMLHRCTLASVLLVLGLPGCYLIHGDDGGGHEEAGPGDPCLAEECSEDADGDGFAQPSDCNDLDAEVHPGAYDGCACSEETDNECRWGDGIDQNCDGVPDETCGSTRDGDGDGYVDDDDCDDTDQTIHPGADDCCVDDDVDQDCDGLVDGNAASPCRCARLVDADFDGYAEGADCNDHNRDVNPGEEEVCCDLVDNDCDGMTDDCCDDPSD